MGGEHDNAAIFDLQTSSASSDRYTVVGELARGGLGRVFSATDDELGRPVAIKVPIAPTEAARARFEREAKITARRSCPWPGRGPARGAGRGGT